MDERLKFVARLLDSEKMSALCREFGISRPTGYKIFNRYKDCGLDGLQDRSRRPYRHANQLPFQIERTILHLKREYPCHDRTVHVTKCGRICIGNRKINLSTVFAGQTIGIREVADKIWLVSFMDYDPGFFDEDVGRVEPATNPFVPEL